MFDPVWLGNSIVPRWEAIALLFGSAAVCLVAIGVVIVLIVALVGWLVNPTTKPGKQ